MSTDPRSATSTALLTDHYELTMLDAAIAGGVADRPAVFELFARRLPEGRRYGVVAGTARLVEALEQFRFGPDELGWLDERGFLSDATLAWLEDYRFTGDVHGYPEGEIYFPGSPVVTVSGTFAESVLLETLALSIMNHDTAVASAASRMVAVAGDRPLLEFGGRRTHEQAAVAAARAAYVAGFAGTSNLEAGRRYGIPTLGTSAHAFTMVFTDEVSAFEAQVDALGRDTTLLVDTYDTSRGIERAVAAGGTNLGGIRIDSGDLAEETRKARIQLDDLGATATDIVLSSDLDEYALADLAEVPADSYGVGTRVVTGSGHPTVNFVYKLVARAPGPGQALEGVAKDSADKATVAGRKAAYRIVQDDTAVEERLVPWDAPSPDAARALLAPLVEDGEPQPLPDLDAVRDRHRRSLAELPDGARDIADGEPAIPTVRDL